MNRQHIDTQSYDDGVTPDRTALRALISALAIAALLAATFQPMYLTIFVRDRGALGSFLTELPYRKAPGYREFLDDVVSRVPANATVLFVTSYRDFEQGYYYHFSRAEYRLPQARVLPTVGPGNVPMAVPAAPDYILIWDLPVRDGAEIVLRSERGALVKVTR